MSMGKLTRALPFSTFVPMRQTILLLALLMLVGGPLGCASQPQWEPQSARQDLFLPSAMRIHPVFTQLRNWSGGANPDGVEVLIEFQDQFGDSVKSAGNVVFEIFQYRPGYPDPRGGRLVNPFIVSTDSIASQRDHWNRTSRCYSFQLACPNINPRQTCVLTATFEGSNGKRFFDTLVIEPPAREKSAPAPVTRPVKEPGVRSTQP